MKLIKILSMSLLFCLFAFIGKAQNTTLGNTAKSNQIEVIDFHSTHRCFTCNAIEKHTKYTLDTYFQKELEEGTIVFKVINVDDEKNYTISEKFKASGTALFLNITQNGKEKTIDLTNFAFMKGKDKTAFSEQLKSKIEVELNNL